MKKQLYKNLKVLLCTMATSVVVSGCGQSKPNVEESASKTPKMTVEESTSKISEPVIEETFTTRVSDNEMQVENDTGVSSNENKESREKKVIQYIDSFGSTVDNCVDSVSETLKNGFITIVDFLFYEGEICDMTFAELSTSAKVKIVNIASNVVQKVNQKFPTLLEVLGEKYNTASVFLLDKKEELIHLVEEKIDEEKRNEISEYYNKAKDSVSDTYNKAKQKVKKWYEEFRDQ